ncbi:MAG TPA: endonuclease/exonuclease/phosphatase family protein, partial [Nevskiaceae bacterium]|nr:endonuclease/exonuclease/phosphatase family protein [Nevskiaceae bacterium]
LAPEHGSLDLVIAHMSLGRGTQQRQLDYVGRLLGGGAPAVLMGDFNCDAELLRGHPELRRAGLLTPAHSPPTFPSWQPRRAIDHILVGGGVELHSLQALPHRLSDHLPLAAEISLATP